MRVVTTPMIRDLMTPEALAYIEQERDGRDGCTLLLSWSSRDSRVVGRFRDPEAGDFYAKDFTIVGVLVDLIGQVQA